MSNLILDTKKYNLSTRGSGGNILNEERDYKSSIEYNIPDMIVRDESIEYIQFSIPYAVIPVSFYLINENNCVLNYAENGINKSVRFDYGNYNASMFIKKFTENLGSQWELALDNFNSVFAVFNSSYHFILYKSSTISSIMGFSENIVPTNVNGVYEAGLNRCCNFMSLPRVCIRCSELITENNMIGSKNKSSDLVISVPNNSRPNGQIYYQNQTQIKALYRGNSLNRIVISFTDDDGNFLNFNGVSSFFVLQFDIFRQFVPKLPSFSNIVNMVNSKTIHYPDEEIMET